MKKYVVISVGGLAIIAGCIYALIQFLPYHLPLYQSNEDGRNSDVTPDLTTTEENDTSILMVGDVMLGRYVGILMERHDTSYPFEKIGSLFADFDHVLINLEGPITERNLYPNEDPIRSMKFHFKPYVAEVLHREGITAANLANNHALDQGGEGFFDTKRYLAESGITHSGSATNDPQSFGFATTTNGIPLVFAGFNATWPNDPTAFLAYLGAQGEASIVIVSVHWGEEYALMHNADQESLAHAFIDAGADVVVGHHPHVVQDVAIHNGRLIFYSLGNFIFDQYFSPDVEQGLALGIHIEKSGLRAFLTPLESAQSQPQPMADVSRTAFLKALAERSDVSLSESIALGEIYMPLYFGP